MAEGAAYMAELAKDAGFAHVEIVPTDGHPGVFGTIDVGAPRTLGIYFMYDVKQFDPAEWRSEEHTSELQSLMRISYAVFCLKKKKKLIVHTTNHCYSHLHTKHITSINS